MHTSVKQDRDFILAVISSNLLEDAIEYIKSNFEAEEIFGVEALRNWAEENDYIKEE